MLVETRPVRLGIVGAGVLAERVLQHLVEPDVRDDVEVVAVCDTDPSRAKSVAEAFGVSHAYVDFDEFLADPNIDAVSIATPIALHAEQGLKALKAGKHVHINKAMATTVAEADQLINTADAQGLFLVASPGEALRPEVERTRRHIESGDIGDVEWAVAGMSLGIYHETEAERSENDMATGPDPSWYFQSAGGGPLYDGAVYQLHRLTRALGPVSRVSAMSRLARPVREFGGRQIHCTTDDTVLMLLEFESGVIGFAYGVSDGDLGEFGRGSVFGSRGTLVNGSLTGGEQSKPGEGPEDQIPGFPHVNAAHASLREPHVFEDIMQLVDSIRTGKPSVVRAEQARHVVDVIESALRSARSGRTESVMSTT